MQQDKLKMTFHSVLRETKMFKNSYIIGIDVEIRLVCLQRCNLTF